MFTSAGDMSSLGRAIMRSTLLKPAVTRRWLKPFAFTSDHKSLVGMPWGVRQINISQGNILPLALFPPLRHQYLCIP